MTLFLTAARPARRRIVFPLAVVAATAAVVLGLTAWTPSASAGTVPSGARVLTVTPVFGQDPNVSLHHLDHAFTITDPAKVARIAAVINGLSPFPVGELSCAADNAAAMRLTFRDRPHGPVVATLLATYTGCTGVSRPGGRLLEDYTRSGQQVQRLVLASAGVCWPYTPDVLPPLPR